jgi:HUS1 checkpoint protein
MFSYLVGAIFCCSYEKFIFLQTLVQVPDLPQLQNLVDRLKNIGDLLTVNVTQYGDLHLQVSTSLVTVGSEFKRLRILGVRGKL